MLNTKIYLWVVNYQRHFFKLNYCTVQIVTMFKPENTNGSLGKSCSGTHYIPWLCAALAAEAELRCSMFWPGSWGSFSGESQGSMQTDFSRSHQGDLPGFGFTLLLCYSAYMEHEYDLKVLGNLRKDTICFLMMPVIQWSAQCGISTLAAIG